MSLTEKLKTGIACGVLASGLSANAILYDDFISGSLNPTLWQVKQDVEGQPPMDEYDVRNENGNFVFHTQQNSIGDRRVYLVPDYTFRNGDTISYDVTTVSKEGHWGNIVLLTGDQYMRIGIDGYNNGVQGFDDLGTAHVSLTFDSSSLIVNRTTPTGLELTDYLSLNSPDGSYGLYIGSFSGHNGMVHMDYDNFKISSVPEPMNTGLIASILLGGCAVAYQVGKRKQKS